MKQAASRRHPHRSPEARSYYDRKAGIARVIPARAPQPAEEGQTLEAMRWDRGSSVSWEEFISRWEHRHALG